MSDFNDGIIEEFRAGGGHVETYGFGSGLVLMHTTGARSGVQRVIPVAAQPAGDAWDVIGSAAGATKHPAWYFNLIAHPDLSIEVPDGDGVRTVAVHADELEGDEWTRSWAGFTQRSAAFERYAATAQGRRFPIVRLRPTG